MSFLSFLCRCLLSLLVTLVALIPAWIYLLAKSFFVPEGFWQNLVLAGLSIWILWGIQCVLAVVAFFVLVVIWFHDCR
ncbi:MAG: hypothetical protein WC250_03355 [Candidatus Paceibacterota bacterium]|jgi:hypothetical protein